DVWGRPFICWRWGRRFGMFLGFMWRSGVARLRLRRAICRLRSGGVNSARHLGLWGGRGAGPLSPAWGWSAGAGREADHLVLDVHRPVGAEVGDALAPVGADRVGGSAVGARGTVAHAVRRALAVARTGLHR